MRIQIDPKMKEWVSAYIRTHRPEGQIGIHVVFSKFNEDFRTTFKVDPRTVVQLMVSDGFLCGRPAKGGYFIWLPEDSVVGTSAKAKPVAATRAAPLKAAEKMSTPPATPSPTVEESETADKQDDNLYAFERIPHPVTGEVNVIEFIRYFMQRLTATLPEKAEMDGAYVILKFKVTEFYQSLGLDQNNFPTFRMVLQHMGLIRLYGKGVWGVLPGKLAQHFITERAYELARAEYRRYWKRQNIVSILRAKVKKVSSATSEAVSAEAQSDKTDVATAASFEAEAVTALAEAERLAGELADARAHIVKLEAKLASKASPVDAARQALQERLAALRANSILETSN